MSSNDPIEKLYISLEADASKLLSEAEAAITKAEAALTRLDRKAKKVGKFQRLRDGFQSVAKFAKQAAIGIGAVAAAITLAIRSANAAVRGLRAERAFKNLAASMGQSADAILEAIDRASLGTIDRMKAIELANDALLLSVAKTPEEIERAFGAAVVLGRAKGLDAATAITTFVNAAGRRATEVLDNLGLSLADVNAEMDRMARAEFGIPLTQLTQVQRSALFTQAAITVAAQKAEQLGGNIEDAATDMERTAADAAELSQSLGEAALVTLTLANRGGETEGIINKLIGVTKTWQQLMILIAATVETINDQLTQVFGKTTRLGDLFSGKLFFRGVKDLLKGESIFVEPPKEPGKSFVEQFRENLEGLALRYKDVLGIDTGEAIPGPTFDPEPTDESAAKIVDTVRDMATELIEIRDESAKALEQLETDHAKRLADIAADLTEDLADLAEETAEKQADIFKETRRDLEELARDTDERLSDERHDFQTEERRDTEDHLRDMRRLTQQYLMDLEDAVKERDARAVVDLQRRFAMESQQREEDFTVNQQRDRQDSDERLAEIRDDEAKRRQEILAAQAEQLTDLIEHEAERRAEIEKSAAELRQKEMESYAERQGELQNALDERLQAMARELAAEKDINEDGARAILTTLANYFGRGGQIDDLMQDYMRRMRQYTALEVRFDVARQTPQTSLGSTLPPIPRFQHGGQMVARRPTLALFGEKPELATFTPLSQMAGGGGRSEHHFSVDFNINGQLPPGINQEELKNQMAGVVLSALRDTGVLER